MSWSHVGVLRLVWRLLLIRIWDHWIPMTHVTSLNHAMLHGKVVGQPVQTRISVSGNVSWVREAGIHGHPLTIHVCVVRARQTKKLLPGVVHAPDVPLMHVLLARRQAVGVWGAIGPVKGRRWTCVSVVLFRE